MKTYKKKKTQNNKRRVKYNSKQYTKKEVLMCSKLNPNLQRVKICLKLCMTQ